MIRHVKVESVLVSFPFARIFVLGYLFSCQNGGHHDNAKNYTLKPVYFTFYVDRLQGLSFVPKLIIHLELDGYLIM